MNTKRKFKGTDADWRAANNDQLMIIGEKDGQYVPPICKVMVEGMPTTIKLRDSINHEQHIANVKEAMANVRLIENSKNMLDLLIELEEQLQAKKEHTEKGLTLIEKCTLVSVGTILDAVCDDEQYIYFADDMISDYMDEENEE